MPVTSDPKTTEQKNEENADVGYVHGKLNKRDKEYRIQRCGGGCRWGWMVGATWE